ncbi:MAG: helix-turn-helix domain-containing protein [Clostridium sp.]|nr:helix-turn-helix domain-containing protein [Clostridium sp.]
MFEYMTVQETAKLWKISERRVQKLCVENRIPNLLKVGRMWLIPQSAEKPIDKRTKAGKVMIK